MTSRDLRTAYLTLSFILASCSRSGPSNDQSSPPEVSPSAAPGVAFTYDYEFNLADDRISATQEAHAAACEKLGLTRCRITGMSYAVDQAEQVTASLAIKLEPSIARQFGKSAQQTVESSDGKLIRLDIGTSDEGQKIDKASQQRNDSSAQIKQLESELAKAKPGSEARANLMSQISALQRQASEQTHAIEDSQAILASTPMEFRYYGRGGVPGFRGNPFSEAWQTLITTIIWLVNILLQSLAILIPVGLLLSVLVAFWRTPPMRAFRRWFKGHEEVEA